MASYLQKIVNLTDDDYYIIKFWQEKYIIAKKNHPIKKDVENNVYYNLKSYEWICLTSIVANLKK